MTYSVPEDKGAARRWGALGLWLVLIWAFMFVAAPALKRIPAVERLTSYIRESGIPAGAIYYTEVEEVGQGDQAVRNTFRFFLEKPASKP